MFCQISSGTLHHTAQLPKLTSPQRRYLWEKEQLSLAHSFFTTGLALPTNKTSPSTAQGHRLLGHISLDIARPRAALAAYQKSLEIRILLDGPESPFIANIYNSIACSHTEIGGDSLPQALHYLDLATAIHIAHDPSKSARTDAIRALALLRAERPLDALQALRRCWELQGLTQEEVQRSEYPKHSGDIVLRGRIRWALGERGEARGLMQRAVGMRRGVFGEGAGPSRGFDVLPCGDV